MTGLLAGEVFPGWDAPSTGRAAAQQTRSRLREEGQRSERAGGREGESTERTERVSTERVHKGHMPPRRPPKTYQPPAWKQAKEKQKKVERWKTIGSYKRLLKHEGGFERTQHSGPSTEDTGAAGLAQAKLETAQPGSFERSGEATSDRKRTKPLSAQEVARRNYELRQRDIEAEREAARQAADQVRQAKAAAQKRRVELTAKMKKRTKRGQPVLSNQVDAILRKLEAN